MPILKIVNVALRDAFSDLARVHHSHRPGTPAGRIVVIRCNGKSVRLAARGNTDISSLEIDLKTRNALGLAKWGSEVEVDISAARWWDELLWALNASDPMPRIAAWLGAVSLALGVLGALLGGLSVYLSLVLS